MHPRQWVRGPRNLSQTLRRALFGAALACQLAATAFAQQPAPSSVPAEPEASAGEPAPSSAPDTPPASTPAPPAAIGSPGLNGTAAGKPDTGPTEAELQALIKTLEDEAGRAELVAKLRALSAAAPANESDFFGHALDQVNDAVSSRIDQVSQALTDMAHSLQQLPILASWAWQQLTDPISRAMWASIGQQVGAAGLAGLVASLVVRMALRGWRARLVALPVAAKTKLRVKATLACLVVDLAALLTFLGVTDLVLGYTSVSFLAQRVAGELLVAIASVRGATALSKAYLAPENGRRRLSGMDDAAAVEAERWVAVLLGLGLYGYFGLEAALRLGLPWTVHGFLLHLLFLVVAGLTIRAIYRLRAYLGVAIEQWGATAAEAEGIARFLPSRAFAASGHHVLAGWVALVYLAWAVGVPGAASLLTRGMLVTVLALIAARAINIWLDWLILRPLEPSSEPLEEGVEQVAEPLPALKVALITTARLAVALAALLAILQGWGVDVAGWLAKDTGQTWMATAMRIGIISAAILVIAQLVQRGAASYIGATDSSGNLLYSNRTRTLASMARNLALTLLSIIGVIEILSELGVNANALLAGAGVVGLAIGFGAQTLVKDLITGLFILVGDTVRVGDVVDMSGKAGVVEAISMRTITLRAYNGDVHTIPYSSIDVVTNMTKEFSYYVFDLCVAYKEDVDRVIDVLRELDSQLRREWPYRRLILEPLEIAGVDGFREAGVLVKSRMKVRAGEQWKVGREFNRRIKRRFDELGIELPVPQQKVFFGGGPSSDLSPVLIERMRRDAVQKDAAGKA